MSQMLKSSGAMGVATMTSRLLGMVRELVYAYFMGTTGVASAFLFAFNVPNLFRRLLGEGALSAAFIPIFKTKEKTEGEVEMWRAANAVISGLVVASAILVAVAMIVVSIVLATCNLEPQWRLMFELMRMMFPYMVLVCVAAIFMGMLNARGHFFIPAMGAAVLNVAMIASVLLLAPHMGKTLDTQIFALAIGVLVAGVAQAGFQIPTLRTEGFRYRWISPWSDPTVRQVASKMLIGSVGVAAFQLNVVITQCMAFGDNERIVSVFNYAVRLMELPQGVFGISLATYLLPTLSGLAAEKKYPEFRSTFGQGMTYLVFANLLASILLVILAEPIIRLLFEHGRFNAVSTHNVTFALVCLAPGLLAFSLVNIYARAFYALGDIMTPMRISVFCLVINLLISALLLFRFNMGAGALGLANTITSVCNVALLTIGLRKKLKTLELAEFTRQLPPVITAGVAAGVVAWLTASLWNSHLGHNSLLMRMGHVFVPMILATGVYFGIAIFCKVRAAHDMLALAGMRFKRSRA